MSAFVSEGRNGRAFKAVRFIGRTLAAVLLTAFVGAVQNFFYERFFDPELYAAGPPLARGAFSVVLTAPFILSGLIVLGFPTAFALHRLTAESSLTYGLAGAACGALWGLILFPWSSSTFPILCAFYGCTCALFWWWLRPKY